MSTPLWHALHDLCGAHQPDEWHRYLQGSASCCAKDFGMQRSAAAPLTMMGYQVPGRNRSLKWYACTARWRIDDSWVRVSILSSSAALVRRTLSRVVHNCKLGKNEKVKRTTSKESANAMRSARPLHRAVLESAGSARFPAAKNMFGQR